MSISIRIVVVTCLVAYTSLQQGGNSQQVQPDSKHTQHQSEDSQDLLNLIRAMQKKIAVLEASLKQKHAADTSSNASANAPSDMNRMKNMDGKMMSGKKGMSGSKGKMGMMKMDSMPGGGMMGMGNMMKKMPGKSMSRGMMMMGKMKSMGTMSTPSSLPGFPGASHIYHIGADGFFLNHEKHISLTETQQRTLNKIKEEALLNQAEFDRKIESAEQESWVLTSSDQPDASKIKAKIDGIATLQAQQRMSFIRAVGKAAGVLTDKQRALLTGTAR